MQVEDWRENIIIHLVGRGLDIRLKKDNRDDFLVYYISVEAMQIMENTLSKSSPIK